jgi:excisionase family DNA binding protein
LAEKEDKVEERHLSLSETTDVLDISERTAYRWIKSGKLRAYKPGRDYRIPESAIRELMERSEAYPKDLSPRLPLEERGASLDPMLWRQYCENLADLFEGLAETDVPPSRALGWWDVAPKVAGYTLAVVDALAEGVRDGTVYDDQNELIPLLRAAFRLAYFADALWNKSAEALAEEIEQASVETQFWKITEGLELTNEQKEKITA